MGWKDLLKTVGKTAAGQVLGGSVNIQRDSNEQEMIIKLYEKIDRLERRVEELEAKLKK